MTLNNLISRLQDLQAQGHGNLDVFYRHGASGDSGPLGHPSQEEIDGSEDCGDLVDMDIGEKYISIYAGN